MRAATIVGMISLLLLVSACDMVTGTAIEAAHAPGSLPAGLSEYVFLHHIGDENSAVHTMANVKSCQ